MIHMCTCGRPGCIHCNPDYDMPNENYTNITELDFRTYVPHTTKVSGDLTIECPVIQEAPKCVPTSKKDKKKFKPDKIPIQEGVANGDRFNDGKIDYTLLPPEAMDLAAKVFMYGSTKYDDFNWCKGLKYRTILASLKRHLRAFEYGEDMDEESKHSHVAHICCNIFMLAFMTENRTDLDDRFKLEKFIPTYEGQKKIKKKNKYRESLWCLREGNQGGAFGFCSYDKDCDKCNEQRTRMVKVRQESANKLEDLAHLKNLLKSETECFHDLIQEDSGSKFYKKGTPFFTYKTGVSKIIDTLVEKIDKIEENKPLYTEESHLEAAKLRIGPDYKVISAHYTSYSKNKTFTDGIVLADCIGQDPEGTHILIYYKDTLLCKHIGRNKNTAYFLFYKLMEDISHILNYNKKYDMMVKSLKKEEKINKKEKKE